MSRLPGPPLLTIEPASVQAFQFGRLTCTSFGDAAVIRWHWYKNGEELRGLSGHELAGGFLSTSDDYQCSFTDSNGESPLSNTITVPTQPDMPSLVMEQENVQDGDFVNMTCVPAGDEEVTQWMWYANGGLVRDVRTQSVAFTFDLGREASWAYRCAISDETGTSELR